jgi:hypothetical protein
LIPNTGDPLFLRFEAGIVRAWNDVIGREHHHQAIAVAALPPRP